MQRMFTLHVINGMNKAHIFFKTISWVTFVPLIHSLLALVSIVICFSPFPVLDFLIIFNHKENS